MEILIFKETKDEDLKVGLTVCYRNTEGVFAKIGKITDAYFDYGIKLYLIDTSWGAYSADELKLIK